MGRLPFSVYDFFGYLASGFIVLMAVDWSLGCGALTASSLPGGLVLSSVVAAYILGHAVAHLSGAILESGVVRSILGGPETHLLSEAVDVTGWRRVLRGYFTPLPGAIQSRIRLRAARDGVDGDPRSLFLHAHAVAKRDAATSERLNSFLNLYGFARNVAMALLLAAATLVTSRALLRVGVDAPTWYQVMGACCVAIVLSFIMVLRYLKFLRHFSLEVLVSYSAMQIA